MENPQTMTPKVGLSDTVAAKRGKVLKARLNLPHNVSYVLRDEHGNVKPIFVANELGRAYMEEHKVSDLTKLPEALMGSLGTWEKEMDISNLVTNAGMAGVASRINGADAEAAFTYIAIGTDATAADVTDTTLGTEIAASGGSRAAATASRVTTDVTNDTAQLVHTFTFSGTLAIVESGVLNAASVGVLLAHQVFSAINVASGDSLQITWKFDVD